MATRVANRLTIVLPAAIVLLLAWAVVLVVTGGVDFSMNGMRIRSRDPFRPATIALGLVVLHVIAYRRRAPAHAAALQRAIERVGPILSIAIAVCTLVIGLRHGSFVAGGSDSYGYVSQSELWRAGDLIVEQPIAREVPWPNADWVFTPLGYRPAESGGAIVPTYAAGLPLLMAVSTTILAPLGFAGCGPFVVVPVMGAAMVWLTYQLAQQLMSRTVGLAAAIVMATSPAFVASHLVPMSDVPVAAVFLAAVVFALNGRACATGFAVGLAVLVRPNLVPLAALFGLYAVSAAWRARGWRAAAMALVWFAAGGLPAIAGIALINAHLYGAPWKSGYGDLRFYFAWRHGPMNASRFTRWLLESQTPFLLAAAIPFAAWRKVPRERRAPIVFIGSVAAATWISYLFYLPFETWEYLRFLLPSYPLLIVLALMGSQLLLSSRLREGVRTPALAVLVLAVVSYQMRYVRDAALLRQWEAEAAIVNVGRFIDRSLPRNAVLVSMFHSGSVRHYAGRLTVRYDWLDRAAWPQALDVLVARGYRPFLVLSDWEEPQFREHFNGRPEPPGLGALVAVFRHPRVRIYDPLAAPDRAPAPLSIPSLPCPCRGGSRVVLDE